MTEWIHAERAVWVKKHLVTCHPGDLRHLFLEGLDMIKTDY